MSQIYDLVGFNRIKDEILSYLVIAHIYQPTYKLVTTAHPNSYYKVGSNFKNNFIAWD